MSCEFPVISVKALSKSYQIYGSPRARLLQFVVPRLQQLLGLQARRYYSAFDALHDVGFSVGKGETVGIIGRNGSGKSTLLQIICGTLAPTSGDVSTNGRVAALLELGSGFNPEFTGRENVYLNGTLLGLTARQIDERYAAIAAFAGIGDFIEQPIKTYSSGMVVRLAFATAIHVDPDILVVDEALAVGDTAFQQKCLNRIRSLQENGVSILLVTHSANTLIEYCDRGIYLKQGRLVMDGACRDVVRTYNDDLLREEGGVGVVLSPGSADVNPSPRQGAAADRDAAPAQTGQGIDGEGSALPAMVYAPSESPIFIESVRITSRAGNETASVLYGEEVFVSLTLRATACLTSPCFGIQLLSTDGIGLWSATTQQLGVHIEDLPLGHHRLTWKLHADFAANRYVIALGAGQIVEGEYKRRHRLEYAGHFDVLPQPHSGSGWLAPRAEVRINNVAVGASR